MRGGMVQPSAEDDGEREFTVDQIEGPALVVEPQCHVHTFLGFGPVVRTLRDATLLLQRLTCAWVMMQEGKDGWRLHADGTELSREEKQAVEHFEGCDVVVWIDGIRYSSVGDDESGCTWEKNDVTQVVVVL
jgi:hypothetical protein